ncbi:hypothetical protein B0H66DRAFT_467533 [Apodospora peruviana]|uniref:Pre-mRNA splicing factor CLF1 n=1 Tax=Apodospora peruviana TaxID=516989 RepID=A0AAE0MGK5_9PEZI|nr:hypothetical protein B0H66DRAFT_467533 [Apodospora peruviana]
MPLPQPKVPLTDVCSVIFNNTLYTYSADAFQALPLEAGAEWNKLPQGEKVTGGVCVGTTPGDPSTAALFIIGGKGGKADYQGIQKFTYSTGKWEAITLPMPVTQERLWHSAAYINTTDTILVYAGSQDGAKVATSQTFTIGASAPYPVLAYQSLAPPTINPILLPWSPSEVALIGGSTWNKQVMLFSQERQWFDSGASLANPLMKDITAVKAVVITGDDGSKSLYTFDMTESPNSVTRTVLFTGPGAPVPNAVPVAKRALELEEDEVTGERRAVSPLTVNDWPKYNSTLAPTATRASYALALDSDGLAVFAGGNEDDVLCMFDTRSNGWRNATAQLAQVKILEDESSSSTSSTSRSFRTSTASESSTTAIVAAPVAPTQASETQPAVASGGHITSTNTILGAVLGAIFGLAILLFGIYWCIQRQRRQQSHMEAGHVRRSSGISSDEKGGIGFASDSLARGLSGPGVFRGHQPQGSHSSFSSMAILMGRVNQQKPGQSGPTRNPSNTTNHTRNSSADSTFKAFKSTISKPIPQAQQPQPQMRDDKGVSFHPNTVEPKPRNLTGATAMDREDSARRSSGWNRYWSGGSALNMLGFGGGNNGNGGANRRETVESDGSHYSDRHRITQDSATVPPLQIYEPRASFSQVTSRSPTIAVYNEKLNQGMKGQIETQRPSSAVSSVSGYSSGIPASVHETWDPTAASRPWGADRVTDPPYNSAGLYTTPLAPPASSNRSTGQPYQPPPVRDDMSWLNLGDNGR